MNERTREYGTVIVARAADFFCEAAVLVFVFSLLEEFLRGGISLGWILSTFLISFYFFGAGIVITVEGQRRLRGRKSG